MIYYYTVFNFLIYILNATSSKKLNTPAVIRYITNAIGAALATNKPINAIRVILLLLILAWPSILKKVTYESKLVVKDTNIYIIGM